jgi:hypothetical protein
MNFKQSNGQHLKLVWSQPVQIEFKVEDFIFETKLLCVIKQLGCPIYDNATFLAPLVSLCFPIGLKNIKPVSTQPCLSSNPH